MEGHTQEQIAGLLQVSRKTVNRKIRRIKKKLGIIQKNQSPLKKGG
jgi:DNA-binding CsgD family transcriptional regulator